MKLSVIIPTYNEEDDILLCLESLGEQTYGDFEIIVVDDGSGDNTPKRVKNLEKEVKNISFYTQNHKGPGAARNLGAGKAKGDILVFVDADMTFDKNFLKELVGPIEKGESKGTFSREEFVSNWVSLWARCWNINEGWEEERRHPIDYPNTQPVFRAILKSEFERVGGFDPGGYTDDWSLSKKLGYPATSAKGAKFYHRNPDSLPEIFNHAMWVGKRKYKFGVIGSLIALFRASFPISIIVGLYKAIINGEPLFLIFKVIYDLGLFIGIVTYLISGKGAK